MANAERGGVFSLVYVSSAVIPFSVSDLNLILAKSHEVNTRLGVTGMLLYKLGNVMQVLEGEESVVRTLYGKIANDPRHRGLLALSERRHAERDFQDWSMGFRDLSTVDIHAVPGYSEFMNTPLNGVEFTSDPSRCQKLLMNFKRKM